MADWGSNDPVVAQTPPSPFGANDEVVQPGTAKQPDKYHQAALDVQKQLQAKGFDTNEGYSGRFVRGRTLGAAGDLASVLATPIEMAFHKTWNPVEGWRYAKAMDDVRNQEAEEKTGVLGKVAELAGGLQTGIGNAKAGYTFLKEGMTLPQSIVAGAKEGAAYGGATGFFNGGDNLSDKFDGAGKGILLGGALGGATPVVGSAISSVASPIVSNIRARINPEAFARSKVADALANSGKSLPAIEQDLSNASAAGQSEYTLADALGNSGQRALSTVTRAPGPGRQPAVDFLENRQAGQAGRVVGQLDQALGTNGETAQQASKGLMQKAAMDAEPLYTKALGNKPIWNDRLQEFLDDPVAQEGLRRGIEIQRLEALAKGQKFNPNDIATVDFNDAMEPIYKAVPNMRSLDAVKKGVDHMLEDYRNPMTGRLDLDQRGRAIEAVRKAYVNTLDKLNPDYAAARQAWAGPASIDSAIDLGGNAATRGRAVDNVNTFNSLNQPQQQGFRHGYADSLAARAERGGAGANAVRPLTSQKSQSELAALSRYEGPARPGDANQLAQRLNRENTMFETRRQAIGGSQTADNLADESAAKIDPGFVAALLGGHYGSAVRQAVHGATNAAKGLTPDVRAELGRLLLSGHGSAPQSVAQALAERAKVEAIANALKSGALAGGGELRARAISGR